MTRCPSEASNERIVDQEEKDDRDENKGNEAGKDTHDEITITNGHKDDSEKQVT
jgi:hypothetical protein